MTNPTTSPTSSLDERPPQLAAIRIGAGRAIHLGSLSSRTGPYGEPRYVSWCPASQGRDGVITVGAPVSQHITCRRCLRAVRPEVLDRAHAVVDQLAAQESEVLPHTGMRAPHTRLTLRKLRFIPTEEGEAYSAQLLLDGRPIGLIENHGCGGETIWYPYNQGVFGQKDMTAFVAGCRDEHGEKIEEEFVLADLVYEARAARDVARYLRAGQQPVRTLTAIVNAEDTVLDIYPSEYLGAAGDWTDRREQLAALMWRHRPEAYAIEMWTGQEWVPLTAAGR